MSKGIMAQRPGGSGGSGSSGRIMVTEGAIDPTQMLDPGTILKFDESTTSKDGDLLEFVIDAATGMPANITTLKAGTVYTGDVNQDIDVNPGESVLLTAAKYEGTIKVNGGVLAIVGNSAISGKVQSTTADSFIFIQGGTFDGKLESSNSGNLSVVNCTIVGKVVSSGNKFVAIQSCNITGKSEVANAATSKCMGNTINGKPVAGCS